MRKILIFSLVYYPKYVGGAEVAVKEITDRISSEEMHFDMIALNGGGEALTEKYGNVTVHRILGKVGMVQKLLYPFAAYRKARELSKVGPRYDAVWSIMASYAGFAGFLFKRKFPAVPHLLTIQEGDHFERRAGILSPFFRWIFKSADRIQVISEFLAQWSRERGATCEVTVVPNAVDIELFSTLTSAEDQEKLKSQLGKKPGDVFVITTSRLTLKNGIADVIHALTYLPDTVKFIILGTGELESSLKTLTTRLKLEGRVTFVGFVPHADMPPYLHISDIFIRPSLTEGLGNSFLEAMAAGLPVIATPVGGIPDFLTDGETGLFCEVGKPRSIAQKIEKLMRDRESRDYIVTRTGQTVREKYGWKRVAGMMKEIFLELI
jgi:glycosyltransferase involved in cell wall biosynthesis